MQLQHHAQPKEMHPASSELRAALSSCRGAFIGVAVFSTASNILMLTGSIFMLEVYDRVLPSRSLSTLAALVILVVGLFGLQALLEIIRGRLLIRIGGSLDEALGTRVYQAVLRRRSIAPDAEAEEPLRDIDTLRAFLSGFGPGPIFDLPWLPIFVALVFALHPLLGFTALGGAIILVSLTFLTHLLTSTTTRATHADGLRRNSLTTASLRNAEVVSAMGMAPAVTEQWDTLNRRFALNQRRVSDITTGLGSLSKVLRLMLQSAMLAVGAYLVIEQEATAGIIIASSILTARALAPVDTAIANWKGFAAARHSWRRLNGLLASLPAAQVMTALPRPSKSLSLHNAGAAQPGGTKLLVQNLSFGLKAGDGLGIIGPSGSGKSSLARLLVGVWRPATGAVRIDGATLDQWTAANLGRHIGYLPQDVQLFGGTIAQNISRLAATPDSQAVIAAARSAGVHELILSLPGGYDMDIRDAGSALSAGQRQRLALARALYGDPFLVVLDEPSSNLDEEGEAALTATIRSIRARGGIVVVIAHRPAAIVGVDQLLVMNKGRMHAFGPKDDVLARVVRPEGAPTPLKVVSTAGQQAV